MRVIRATCYVKDYEIERIDNINDADFTENDRHGVMFTLRGSWYFASRAQIAALLEW